MSEKDKAIIGTFKEALPKLSDKDKDRLLWFGEGLAFMADQMERTGKAEEVTE